MSRGQVDTRAFTDVDTTPHDGHAAAVCSAVATCTTRVPSASRSTRSTCTPGSPNNNVVPSDTALGSLLQSESVATSDFGRPRASSCNDTPYEGEITTAPLKLKSRYRHHDPRGATEQAVHALNPSAGRRQEHSSVPAAPWNTATAVGYRCRDRAGATRWLPDRLPYPRRDPNPPADAAGAGAAARGGVEAATQADPAHHYLPDRRRGRA